MWKAGPLYGSLMIFLVLAGGCGEEIGSGQQSTSDIGDAGAVPDVSDADSAGPGLDLVSDGGRCSDCFDLDVPEDGAGVDTPMIPDVVELTDAEAVDGAEVSTEVTTDMVEEDQPAEPAQFDPSAWGPHEVGTTSFQWLDIARLRMVPVTVWYPAIPMGQPRASYLVIIPGKAYTNAPADKENGPYPLVLFSHGFRGTAVQSITFTEYLASHGYVVAAMDHQGNTLTDFFADDEKVADVALERPSDVAFTYQKMTEFVVPGSALLAGMVDTSKVAVSGHSFGGYTALVVAGGKVDVSGAQAACAAGDPSDIFCDYVGYWESGTTVGLEPGIPNLMAAASFAPGGYSAFGEDGLTSVGVPSLIFGGTLDDTCPVDVEIEPIYAALPKPKGKVIITDASHMSFTNICDIPLAQQFLADYCDVAGIIGEEEGFAVMNTLTVAFFDYYLKGQSEYLGLISQDSVNNGCACAQVVTDW
jgi:predicted dienelactone hydrolase